MKKSVCTSGFKEYQLEEVLSILDELNIDGIELWIGHIEEFQEKYGPLDKLRDLIQERGYEVPIISEYTSFSSGIAGEDSIEREIHKIERSLDIARQLKCPMVRTFAGNKSSRDASPEQWGQMIFNMKKVMSLADMYEVDIALEIHYDTFADNTESVKRLIEEINHPRLKILFDGANLKVEKVEQLDALSSLYHWVNHIHLKNYYWDHSEFYKTLPVPAFKGDLDNHALIKELEVRKYKGFVSLEYFGDKKLMNIKESLKEWR